MNKLKSNIKLLSDDFDPWYVLLSEPAIIDKKKVIYTENPELEKKFIDVKYDNLKKEAEQKAQLIIRERWRELRLLSPSQQVATILSSKKFRNGNSFDVKNYLTKCLENSKESIQFVLPSFPFKIPNPLKTWHHNLDAGEMLCLQRLYLISFLTQELMNKKTEFIIISDGLIYSDLCDVDAFEYKSYSQRAKQIIDKMGIQDNIKYVDMMNDVLSDKQDEYDQTLQQVQHELKDWWKNNMSGNINTNDIDYSVLRSMTQENVNSVFEVYSETLQRRASQKAFEFTSKLVTLRVMDAVLQKYEDCIRATVHPKPGQFGIHLVNSNSRIFPWQGVILKNNSNEFHTTSTQEAWKEAKYEVFEKESGDFLYYSANNIQDGINL